MSLQLRWILKYFSFLSLAIANECLTKFNPMLQIPTVLSVTFMIMKKTVLIIILWNAFYFCKGIPLLCDLSWKCRITRTCQRVWMLQRYWSTIAFIFSFFFLFVLILWFYVFSFSFVFLLFFKCSITRTKISSASLGNLFFLSNRHC